MVVGEVGYRGSGPLRWELGAGAGVQLLLLAVLWVTVGLTMAGWVAGAVFTVGCWVVLLVAFRRARTRTLGPANRVTLARVLLIGGVTALAVSGLGEPAHTVMVVLAAVALLLDTVDGRVARRTGTASELGARFDIEADAFLVLVLCVFVAVQLGAWWVLTIGFMRYAFVAAAWVWPWLSGPLEHSQARKLIGALQGIALLVAASGLLPDVAGVVVVAVALALLCWSFGRDVVRLYGARAASGGG
jgi:phosphatidylglycerophosphate synthase